MPSWSSDSVPEWVGCIWRVSICQLRCCANSASPSKSFGRPGISVATRDMVQSYRSIRMSYDSVEALLNNNQHRQSSALRMPGK